jgi:hypothetical protein
MRSIPDNFIEITREAALSLQEKILAGNFLHRDEIFSNNEH